jgi:hypothetical protein
VARRARGGLRPRMLPRRDSTDCSSSVVPRHSTPPAWVSSERSIRGPRPFGRPPVGGERGPGPCDAPGRRLHDRPRHEPRDRPRLGLSPCLQLCPLLRGEKYVRVVSAALVLRRGARDWPPTGSNAPLQLCLDEQRHAAGDRALRMARGGAALRARRKPPGPERLTNSARHAKAVLLHPPAVLRTERLVVAPVGLVARRVSVRAGHVHGAAERACATGPRGSLVPSNPSAPVWGRDSNGTVIATAAGLMGINATISNLFTSSLWLFSTHIETLCVRNTPLLICEVGLFQQDTGLVGFAAEKGQQHPRGARAA